MVNKNYVKGRRKEYDIMNRLKDEGFDIVFRTAGSHSPIDVVGISKKFRYIRFIQCKPESLSAKKRLELESELKYLNHYFLVKFEVI